METQSGPEFLSVIMNPAEPREPADRVPAARGRDRAETGREPGAARRRLTAGRIGPPGGADRRADQAGGPTLIWLLVAAACRRVAASTIWISAPARLVALIVNVYRLLAWSRPERSVTQAPPCKTWMWTTLSVCASVVATVT